MACDSERESVVFDGIGDPFDGDEYLSIEHSYAEYPDLQFPQPSSWPCDFSSSRLTVSRFESQHEGPSLGPDMLGNAPHLASPTVSVGSQSCGSVPSTSGLPTVSVCLIVDPLSNMIICPPQLLTHTTPSGLAEAALVGSINPLPVSAELLQALEVATPHWAMTRTIVDPFPTPFPIPSQIDAGVAVEADKILSQSLSLAAPKGTPSFENLAGKSSATRSYKQSGCLPPLKPLSAYNFFFRDERERILHGGRLEPTPEKAQDVLHQYWYQDRVKRRPHRKVEGLLDFSTLSKLISARWRSLTDQEKAFYGQIARRDLERFRSEQQREKPQSDNEPVTTGKVNAKTVG